MSSVYVYIVVEGATERTFVEKHLAPELGEKEIFLHAAVIGPPRRKGGNVRFDRAKPQIKNFLKQRPDTYVSTLFDYYGINPDWPGRSSAKTGSSAIDKAKKVEVETLKAIKKELSIPNIDKRFIPYIAMHEFEALLFSDAPKLAEEIGVSQVKIEDILKECAQPEEINDSSETAPSKRLEALTHQKYKKIKMGDTITKAIGIKTMRAECPHFNEWITKLESLAKSLPIVG